MIVLAVFTDVATNNGVPLSYPIADAIRETGSPVVVVPVPLIPNATNLGPAVAAVAPLLWMVEPEASLVSVVWSGAGGTGGTVPPSAWRRNVTEAAGMLEHVSDRMLIGEPPLVRDELGDKRVRRWARRLVACWDRSEFRVDAGAFDDIAKLSESGVALVADMVARQVVGLDEQKPPENRLSVVGDGIGHPPPANTPQPPVERRAQSSRRSVTLTTVDASKRRRD